MRLPASGAEVPLDLEVEPEGDGERWTRHLGRNVMITHQRPAPDSLLFDSLGPFTVAFELQADTRGLFYRQRRVRLTWGGLNLPLPYLIAPQAVGLETVTPDGNGVDVQVAVRVPLLGIVLAYRGSLQVVEPQT